MSGWRRYQRRASTSRLYCLAWRITESDQGRSARAVASSGDPGATELYYCGLAAGVRAGRSGWQVLKVPDWSEDMIRQIIHAERDQGGSVKAHVDEVVPEIRDDGLVWVHHGERSERERPATSKAGLDGHVRAATCADGASTTRATGAPNWNVIAVLLDVPQFADAEAACGPTVGTIVAKTWPAGGWMCCP